MRPLQFPNRSTLVTLVFPPRAFFLLPNSPPDTTVLWAEDLCLCPRRAQRAVEWLFDNSHEPRGRPPDLT